MRMFQQGKAQLHLQLLRYILEALDRCKLRMFENQLK